MPISARVHKEKLQNMNTFKKDCLKIAHTQHPTPTKKYGKATQDSITEDTTEELSKDKKKVQQIVGSTLYNARTVTSHSLWHSATLLMKN